MGSLGAGTDISNIHYRNVYSQNCNQMYMIKSYGGSGTVKNVKLENFWGHTNAYTLDLNAYWTSMTQAAGSGVSYQNVTFSNWKGTNSNGAQRGSIQVLCPSAVPCTGITISDVNIWTESGSAEKEICQNAFGTGSCLRSDSGATYTTTVTRTTARYAPSISSLQSNFVLWLTTVILKQLRYPNHAKRNQSLGPRYADSDSCDPNELFSWPEAH